MINQRIQVTIVDQPTNVGEVYSGVKVNLEFQTQDLSELLSNLKKILYVAGYNYVEELHAICGSITHTDSGESFDTEDDVWTDPDPATDEPLEEEPEPEEKPKRNKRK